ncbi:MAG: AEC family transporter [Ruminococcaceae bacterium]|nr:AEC family transporter [Oscillospiraceae bacterium]
MDSLLFALNAITPIVATVAIGYLLKKIGLMDQKFTKMANKLVFRVFLPCMLFLNVYKIKTIDDIDLGYVGYVAVMLFAIFVSSLPAVLLVTKRPDRRGPLWQATFRSNFALIGIPLAQSLFGEEGAMVATLLSAFVVPAFNVLAVISLSLFRRDGGKTSVVSILTGIVKNPLIQSIAAGLLVLCIRALFVKNGISFRLADITPAYTVLDYMSRLATPVALLCLGSQFEFSAIREMKREIVFGTLVRTVIVPTLSIGTAALFFRNTFIGAHFAAFVAAFATPVAVSSVPMTQEMNGDATLAGQLVVWSTLLSALSIFLFSFLLKLAGIF